MNRHRYPTHQANSSGEKAQLVLAYQELGKELNSTQLKVVGNYTLGRIIGEGSFGTVRLGVHRLTGSRVAIKHIPKSASPPLLTREIHHHRRLHHPNVVQLYEVIATEHSIWLITELCPGGELFDYLVEKTRFSESEARRIFGQICLGLGYVHHLGVVHRDLKLENILLDERCNPKLADFGFGREFEPRKLLDTFCGTTGYAAPEMLAGRKYYGQDVDIWSLGVILHALLTGSLPFDDDDEEVMKSMIMVGKFEVPNFLSEEASSLIKSILVQDPKSRLSIQQILSHPWFTIAPSQHIFFNDHVSRPSTIAEESNYTSESPTACSKFPNSPMALSVSSSTQPPDCDLIDPSPSAKAGCSLIGHSDTSVSSGKDSDADLSSSFSTTSSPQDSTPSSSKIITAATSPSTSVPHRNNSNATLKSATPHPNNQNWQNTPASLYTHPETDINRPSTTQTTASLPVTFSPSPSACPSSSISNLPDHTHARDPTQPMIKIPPPKPRPLSILPCLPSSIAHPQIRTPSRTKRRSIGSTMSERIPPDDIQADLATPTPHQSRLSTSSLSNIMIDYLAAFHATTSKTALMSEDDVGQLKLLTTLGFDTGQIIHSVQSNACDSSGAMWWLLKRKMEKAVAEREYTERMMANHASTVADYRQGVSSDSLNTAHLKSGPSQLAADVSVETSTSSDSVISTSSSRQTTVVSQSQPIPTAVDSQRPGPVKVKLMSISGGSTTEPLLNPIKVSRDQDLATTGSKSGDLCFPTSDGASPINTSKKKKSLVLIKSSSTLHEDGSSSTSSLKIDTPPTLDRDQLASNSNAGNKKLTTDQRKRSQSVSMLQRATHAIATKMAADDRPKARTRQASAAEVEGIYYDSTHKRDSRRGKDSRFNNDDHQPHSKSSTTMQLAVLFSRKTSATPSVPYLSTTLQVNRTASPDPKQAERGPKERKRKDLLFPSDITERPSVSMPSSPSKTNELCLTPRRDSDPTHLGSADEICDAPSLVTYSTPSASLTASNAPMDPFNTPKPAPSFPSGFLKVTPISLATQSVTASSPAHSNLSRLETDGSENELCLTDQVPGRFNRTKSNLLSTFRFWFNEDRRKRKRNTAMVTTTHTGGNSSPSVSSPQGGRSLHRTGNSSSVPNRAASARQRKLYDTMTADNQASPFDAADVISPPQRQASKSSRRSSVQSNRQVSGEMYVNKASGKRRSDSSRASVGSFNESRTPTSDRGGGNYNRSKYLHHIRQGSSSSAGSRQSNGLMLSVPLLVGHPGGYLRRTPSSGTTVRRITTTSASGGSGLGRPKRHSKGLSGASSVRTSVSSSDDLAHSRRALGSPSVENAYDVDETIEEEEDEFEEKDAKQDDRVTEAARRSALEKLSGDQMEMRRSSLSGENGVGGSNTRTIFMAHKPYSVFGTPTQAFFPKGISSPATSKFVNTSNSVHGGGSSGGGMNYMNLLKSIEVERTMKGQKLRDVFAGSAGEDGEWVDVDEEDDVCSKYGGGLGQEVKMRDEKIRKKKENEEMNGRHETSNIKKGEGDVSVGSIGMIGSKNSMNQHRSPMIKKPEQNEKNNQLNGNTLVGNWRVNHNPRVLSNLKAVVIEEEEEDE